MAELADVPDLGSGAPGVQVRPLLAAPAKSRPFVRSAFLCIMKYMQKIHCCFLFGYLQKFPT